MLLTLSQCKTYVFMWVVATLARKAGNSQLCNITLFKKNWELLNVATHMKTVFYSICLLLLNSIIKCTPPLHFLSHLIKDYNWHQKTAVNPKLWILLSVLSRVLSKTKSRQRHKYNGMFLFGLSPPDLRLGLRSHFAVCESQILSCLSLKSKIHFCPPAFLQLQYLQFCQSI